MTHFVTGVLNRLRLLAARLRYPRLHFRARCDGRKRFVLRQGSSSRVQFGPSCVLDHDLTIERLGDLSVGERVICGHHCTLAASQHMETASDCIIAEQVSIHDHDRAFASTGGGYREQGFACASERIARNVCRRGKVTIGKGVTGSQSSVIGPRPTVENAPIQRIEHGAPACAISATR